MIERRGPIWEAHLLYERGRYTEAIRLLHEIAANDPESSAAHVLLAFTYVQLDDVQQALREATKARELDPEDATAYAALSMVHARLGDYATAEADIRSAIALDPDDESLRSQLALILLARDRPRSAIESARAGLAVNPRDADLYVTMAGALIDLRRYGEAEAALHEARALAPESAYVHQMLGTLAVVRDRSAEAIASFRESLRIDPQSELSQRGLITALRSRAWLYRLTRGRYSAISGLSTLLGIGLLAHVPYGETPSIVAFVLALILFGLADPIATVFVLADRDGRRAFTPRQRNEARVFAFAIAVTTASGVGYLVYPSGALGFALGTTLFALVFLTFATEREERRVRIAIFIAIGCWYAAVATETALLLMTRQRSWEDATAAIRPHLGSVADTLSLVALLGITAEFFVLALGITLLASFEGLSSGLRRIVARVRDAPMRRAP